jgi:hypothetical protein
MAKEGGMSRDMGMSKQMGMSNGHGGHLYLQTNEIRNSVIHYHRLANGTLTEVERALRGPLLRTRSYPAHVGLQ